MEYKEKMHKKSEECTQKETKQIQNIRNDRLRLLFRCTIHWNYSALPMHSSGFGCIHHVFSIHSLWCPKGLPYESKILINQKTNAAGHTFEDKMSMQLWCTPGEFQKDWLPLLEREYACVLTYARKKERIERYGLLRENSLHERARNWVS